MVEEVLLMVRALNLELSTAWERIWQERLAPLSHGERRARILEDRDLQNWGLGELRHGGAMSGADEPSPAAAIVPSFPPYAPRSARRKAKRAAASPSRPRPNRRS
jgi:hypothetical protein